MSQYEQGSSAWVMRDSDTAEDTISTALSARWRFLPLKHSFLSMGHIIVPVDATTADIPREPGVYILQLECDEGTEIVRLNLQLRSFDDTNVFLSRLTSAPTRPGIPDDVLNERLDQIHTSVLGPGRWINISRHRQQIDDSQHENFEQGASQHNGSPQGQPQQCDNDIAEQVKDDYSQLERREAQGLFDCLHRLTQPKPTASGESKMTCIRKQSRELSSKFSKARFDDRQAQALVELAQAELGPVSCKAFILNACERGLADISNPIQTLPSTQFADMFAYQRKRNGDHGEELSKLFKEQVSKLGNVKKDHIQAFWRKRFEARTLAENAQIVHRFQTSYESEWTEWKLKYKENRSRAFNRILNSLYGFMGANAWVFSASLHASGTLVGEVARIHGSRVEKFTNDTVKDLRKQRFEDLEDKTPIFIYPAWLGWLLGYSYRDICEALGLTNLMDEDPGVHDKLDSLSSKYSDLGFDSEHTVERSELEKKAREAVTVSLGHLREVHKRRGRAGCHCSHHIGQPSRLRPEPREISVGGAPASDRDLCEPSNISDADVCDSDAGMHSAHEHESSQLGDFNPVGGEELRHHEWPAVVIPNTTAPSPSAPLMALSTVAQQQGPAQQETDSLLPLGLSASATLGITSERCDSPRPNHVEHSNQASPALFQTSSENPCFPTGNSPGHGFLHATRSSSPGSDLNQHQTTEKHLEHKDTTDITGYPFPDQDLGDALSSNGMQSSYLDMFDIDREGNVIMR